MVNGAKQRITYMNDKVINAIKEWLKIRPTNKVINYFVVGKVRKYHEVVLIKYSINIQTS